MSADKTAFLDVPISPTGLFGPAVDGFADRFTTAQKASQAMRHFLPKRSSSVSQSFPKPPAHQLPKATIEQGYSLQFARTPPRFACINHTSVKSNVSHVLRTEVMRLLKKGAIEVVPPAQSESGFYSRYFLVPKKEGGLRPILDLRHLNKALIKRLFRMLTLKKIIAQIRPMDWFFSLDLKDAYFHIQIIPRHRPFLRFAFDRKNYQYIVLPF
ncbi:MAG: hypothetical protein ACRDA8_20035, partial [Shewanella sp.]